MLVCIIIIRWRTTKLNYLNVFGTGFNVCDIDIASIIIALLGSTEFNTQSLISFSIWFINLALTVFLRFLEVVANCAGYG